MIRNCYQFVLLENNTLTSFVIISKTSVIGNEQITKTKPSFMQCLELECSNIIYDEFKMTLRKKTDCQIQKAYENVYVNYEEIYHKLFDEAFISNQTVFSQSEKTYSNLTFDDEQAIIDKSLKRFITHETVTDTGRQDVKYSTVLSTW